MPKYLGRVLGLALFVISCSGVAEPEKVQEQVEAVFQLHPEFGSIVNVRPAPAWAHGARKIIATETGEYLVYLREGEIVGVFTFTERMGRIFLTGTCYRGDTEFTVTRRTCRTLFSSGEDPPSNTRLTGVPPDASAVRSTRHRLVS